VTYLKTKDVAPHHIPPPATVEPVLSKRQRKRRRKLARVPADLRSKREKVEAMLPDLGPLPTLDESTGRLMDMLSYRRPSESDSEAEFIDRFIRSVGAIEDAFGNFWLTVVSPDGADVPILWSVHTDTVHQNPGRQSVLLKGPLAFTDDPKSNCLGADDTAGLWLALEMIRADVPGTYLFHREEETGGGGSSWVAKRNPKWLDGFKAAIALDRKGYTDVITHQGFQRCCSDAFAKSLADLLGGMFAPSDDGVFTDTANYVDHIGECTNISVGYFNQHGPTEHVNVAFLAALRDQMIAADWSKLVFEREPGEKDPDWGLYGQWNREPYAPYAHNHGDGASVTYYDQGGDTSRRFKGTSADLIELVRDYPEAIADVLEHDGWTADALELWLERVS
jgi:hypothetical protein